MDIKNLIELKGAIIGMILGDGHITRNGYVQIASISKEYLIWKKEILENLTDVSLKEEMKREGSFGKNPLYLCRTRVHPLYKGLRIRMYLENGRQIDDYIMNTLTPLGLLFWYLDDGNLDFCGGRGMNLEISSNRYSYGDHLLFCKKFNDRFGLRFNIHQKFSKKRNRRYCLLYLAAKDRLKFYDMIVAPYVGKIPTDMLYKIPKRESIVRIMESSKSHPQL